VKEISRKREVAPKDFEIDCAFSMSTELRE
jgi:hypothetical protein